MINSFASSKILFGHEIFVFSRCKISSCITPRQFWDTFDEPFLDPNKNSRSSQNNSKNSPNYYVMKNWMNFSFKFKFFQVQIVVCSRTNRVWRRKKPPTAVFRVWQQFADITHWKKRTWNTKWIKQRLTVFSTLKNAQKS